MLSSREKILAEVAKCDVVCSNCHRIRTWLTRESTSSTTYAARLRAEGPEGDFLDMREKARMWDESQ